eukprot:3409427-Amphidinium_carterae.1
MDFQKGQTADEGGELGPNHIDGGSRYAQQLQDAEPPQPDQEAQETPDPTAGEGNGSEENPKPPKG